MLSLLLDAAALSDRHVRDHVMTLLFAGHDTTTATVAFLFYELARHPEIDAWPATRSCSTRRSTRRCASTRRPGSARAAPPARSSFGGHHVAEGAPVNYSSWASHRLPDVWEEPHAFRPERFAPEARKRIPKGAYVPFGGGSRICLGMRFGQARDPRHRDRRAASASASSCSPASGSGSARRRRSARRVGFRCESGCRFRSEEVVPEGEGGPRWQAASR